MEPNKLSKLSDVRQAQDYITSIQDKYDEIFIFWDINETLLTSPAAFNLKVNKSYDIFHNITKGFSERDGQQMLHMIRNSYYGQDLGRVTSRSAGKGHHQSL